MVTESKHKISMLNRMEFYKLAKWLENNNERLKCEKPSYGQAAEQASKELGFAITQGNLRSAASELNLEFVQDNRKTKNVIVHQLVEVQERLVQQGKLLDAAQTGLRQLSSEIASLRGLVHHLYRQLGANPPPGYTLPIFETKAVTGK